MKVQIGLYEKATPKNLTWHERLNFAKDLGFDYLEISIDETDDRLSRLDWTDLEIKNIQEAISVTGIPITSMCLSGHRRYPLGATSKEIQTKALEIMEKAIKLAVKLGIRNIQLAGYDVYYEEKSMLTREYFIENLQKCVKMATNHQVMLSLEIMDDQFLNSIKKYLAIKEQIRSPWLQVYPDIGNLSAWYENNPGYELELGISQITAVHLKDTISTSVDGKGQFKKIPFGEGCVDFLGLLKTLKRLDYPGPFLVEMWSEEDLNPTESVQGALKYLIPILKEAGYETK